MSKILIIYESIDGHTKKVAETIGKIITEQGCSFDIVKAEEITDELGPEKFDAALVAAAVYAGKWNQGPRKFR